MINITDKKNLESAFAKDFGSPYFPILADLYLNEGDFRRAKMVCEVGLKHSVDNDCGYFILAKIALAEEKNTLAEKWLKRAVKCNPANFNALRMLIRLEFALKRNSNTIMKYIQHVLQYLPKDAECRGWLENLAHIPDNVSKEKEEPIPNNNNDQASNGAPVLASEIIENIDYDLEESMATFTMLHVLKTQKHYQQALAVLKMMESKNIDDERISKERGEIQSLLSKDKNT